MLQWLDGKYTKGKIFLRDDRTKKTWLKEVQEFKLSKYQVTQSLYEEVTGKTPSTFIGNENPVEDVSWLDAISFCNTLSESSDYLDVLFKTCCQRAFGRNEDPRGKSYEMTPEMMDMFWSWFDVPAKDEKVVWVSQL